MDAVVIISVIAGAVAGYTAVEHLRFIAMGRFVALGAGALGGGLGLEITARISANSLDASLLIPTHADAAVTALVTGAIGGAAMVALLGVVRALLAES